MGGRAGGIAAWGTCFRGASRPSWWSYVVLNPVRAGMVAEAGQYRWSSYQAMVARCRRAKACLGGWKQIGC